MKIAVFLPNWIGDVVMATAAIRALRRHYPAAHMVGVYKPYVHGLVEGSPWFAKTIFLDNKGPWRQRWPAAALRLGHEHIDIAVLFPNTIRSAWVAWLAGCKRRIGFNRRMRGLLLTDRIEPVRDAKGRLKPMPIIDDYNRLVEALGCPPGTHDGVVHDSRG